MMLAMDWLAQRASLSPHKTALLHASSGTPLTFAAWNAQVNQLTHWLQSRLLLQKSQRLAILAHNCIEYLDLCFATGKLGAILQHMNWRLSVEELSQLLADPPVALVYNNATLPLVRELQARCPQILYWVAIQDKARPEDITLSERSTFPTHNPPSANIQWDDPWFFCYTGGTTGLPKAAVITHGNVISNAINTVISWGLDCRDMTILNAPLFHAGGLNVFTMPLVYVGGTSIVCEKFDVDILYDLLASQPVTVFFGVPTMFVMMQEHARWSDADFSRLKFVISGGAPCPLPIFEKFWARGVEFKTGYGLTEAGPNTFWLHAEWVQKKPGSVGTPLMHIEVSLVDEQNQPVSTHQIGELRIRGSHVTPGYWKHPEATAEALHDGWLYTGDLAKFDEDGCYYIVGRRKDMFISGGENIYPAEIESVLHACEHVAEAAVIGIPHKKWGEVGVAVIRLQEGHQTTPSSILEFCQGKLARYKIPRHVVFVPELPKTGAGKIDKRQLVAAYTNLTE